VGDPFQHRDSQNPTISPGGKVHTKAGRSGGLRQLFLWVVTGLGDMDPTYIPRRRTTKIRLTSGSRSDAFSEVSDAIRSVTATAAWEETNPEQFGFAQRKAISCSVTSGNEI